MAFLETVMGDELDHGAPPIFLSNYPYLRQKFTQRLTLCYGKKCPNTYISVVWWHYLARCSKTAIFLRNLPNFVVFFPSRYTQLYIYSSQNASIFTEMRPIKNTHIGGSSNQILGRADNHSMPDCHIDIDSSLINVLCSVEALQLDAYRFRWFIWLVMLLIINAHTSSHKTLNTSRWNVISWNYTVLAFVSNCLRYWMPTVRIIKCITKFHID